MSITLLVLVTSPPLVTAENLELKTADNLVVLWDLEQGVLQKISIDGIEVTVPERWARKKRKGKGVGFTEFTV